MRQDINRKDALLPCLEQSVFLCLKFYSEISADFFFQLPEQ